MHSEDAVDGVDGDEAHRDQMQKMALEFLPHAEILLDDGTVLGKFAQSLLLSEQLYILIDPRFNDSEMPTSVVMAAATTSDLWFAMAAVEDTKYIVVKVYDESYFVEIDCSFMDLQDAIDLDIPDGEFQEAASEFDFTYLSMLNGKRYHDSNPDRHYTREEYLTWPQAIQDAFDVNGYHVLTA